MAKGKLIWKGWVTEPKDIPQPVSIVFGANLRPKEEKPLDLQNLEKDPAKAATEYSGWITRGMRKKRAKKKLDLKPTKSNGGEP